MVEYHRQGVSSNILSEGGLTVVVPISVFGCCCGNLSGTVCEL